MPHCRTFGVPKRGNAADEYEDAAAADPAAGRFAVADGVTESSFAGDWARLLVARYVERPVAFDAWRDWLDGPRRAWASAVGGRALPWYAEEKRDAGAYAAFLGVEIRSGDAGPRWSAVAVGDSCLLHLRGGKLVRSFPVTDPEGFGSDPATLGSAPEPGAFRDPPAAWAGGEFKPGDLLALATDALAQWLLRRSAAGKPLGPAVERWLDPSADDAAFAAWVAELRETGQLRNDDVTLQVVAPG